MAQQPAREDIDRVNQAMAAVGLACLGPLFGGGGNAVCLRVRDRVIRCLKRVVILDLNER